MSTPDEINTDEIAAAVVTIIVSALPVIIKLVGKIKDALTRTVIVSLKVIIIIGFSLK